MELTDLCQAGSPLLVGYFSGSREHMPPADNRVAHPNFVEIRVEVTARSFQDAKRLAEDINMALRPLILGDPHRIQSVTTVQNDAPDHGAVAISVKQK